MLSILVGFGLIFVGSLGQGTVSTGGVLFMGPFPIAFGSGPSAYLLALGSVVVAGVMMALMFIWGWRASEEGRSGE